MFFVHNDQGSVAWCGLQGSGRRVINPGWIIASNARMSMALLSASEILAAISEWFPFLATLRMSLMRGRVIVVVCYIPASICCSRRFSPTMTATVSFTALASLTNRVLSMQHCCHHILRLCVTESQLQKRFLAESLDNLCQPCKLY